MSTGSWAVVAAAILLLGLILTDLVQERPASRQENAALQPAIKIDINTADKAKLMLLPGIGPTRAGEIVLDRDKNGAFKSLDDLARVSGLSQASVRDLEPFAICSDETAATSP